MLLITYLRYHGPLSVDESLIPPPGVHAPCTVNYSIEEEAEKNKNGRREIVSDNQE